MFETAFELLGEVVGCDGGRADGPVPATSAGLPSAALTPAQLIDRIEATERLVNALQAEQARDLAAFVAARLAADAAAGVEGRLQGRTITTEIGLALGVASLTAGSRVATAVSAADRHPRLLGLCGSGRVSMAGVRKAVKATEVLEVDQCLAVDAQLAQDVSDDRLTPGMLERAATRRVIAADPDAAAKRAQTARADRRVRLCDTVDGAAALVTKLPAEQALALYQSLHNRARGMRADGDERSIADLMCDLLVEDVTGLRLRPDGCGGDPPEPSRSEHPPQFTPDPDPWDLAAPDPYHHHDEVAPPATPHRVLPRRLPMRVEVQIVMTAATLLGLDDQPALLRGYGAIPAQLAHQIADAAGHSVLRGLFCDPADGRLLAMDAATRCYVGPLRQFGIFRDHRCRLSGARICDLDHIHDVQHGGPTTAGNAQGLAKHPHVVKDHPGVTVTADPVTPHRDGLDGLREHAPTISWTMPTGRTYPLPPPPALDWGSRPCIPAPRPGPLTFDDLAAITARLTRPASPDRDQRLRRKARRTIRKQQRSQRRRPHRQAVRAERSAARQERDAQRQLADERRHRARRSAQLRQQRRNTRQSIGSSMPLTRTAPAP